MATFQIKKEDLKAKDIKSFFARLDEEYPDKWVAILESGDLIARDALAELYSEAEKRSTRIVGLLRASKEGRLLFKRSTSVPRW